MSKLRRIPSTHTIFRRTRFLQFRRSRQPKARSENHSPVLDLGLNQDADTKLASFGDMVEDIEQKRLIVDDF